MVTADTFRLRFSINGSTAYTYKDVIGTAHSATINLLSPGIMYQCQVSSVCTGHGSGYSTPVIFTTNNTPVHCGLPYGLSSSSITTSSALVAWTNMVSADTFRIRYSVFGSLVYSYKNVSGAFGSSTLLSSLIPGTAYQFQVSSICIGLSSGYSSMSVFTTLSGPVHCGVPSGIVTTNISNTSARTNWATSVTADTFRIRYSINGTTNYFYKNITGALYNTLLTNLQPATTYQYQVSSVCIGTGSGYSASVIFATTSAPVSCISPYNLSSSNVTSNSAVLNWTPYVTADSFLIRYSVNGTANYTWNKILGTGGIHSTTLTGLSSGTTYQWQVRTICAGVSISIYSSPSVFITGPMRLANPDLVSSESFEVFPNPADETVYVKFTSGISEDGILRVIDIMGRELIRNDISILDGENLFNIYTGNLAAGVYILNLESPNTKLQCRLVIE